MSEFIGVITVGVLLLTVGGLVGRHAATKEHLITKQKVCEYLHKDRGAQLVCLESPPWERKASK